MKGRKYYSIRTGKNPAGSKLTLDLTLSLFQAIYQDFEQRGYFQEYFGYYCVDAEQVPGRIGNNISAYFLFKLRKDNIWPINDNCLTYAEADLFDVIELLYDHVSLPISGRHHTYGNCGWHYDTFDKESGQEEYRTKINELLRDYDVGYELSPIGEIIHLPITGTEPLIKSKPPTYDPQNVDSVLQEAISCYQLSRSSITDKRNAVNMLAGLLEFLRPKIKLLLTASDENDLFNIANNFGIRHYNEKQKTNYDQEVWLDWIFYYYLATINAIIRLMKKRETT